MANGKKCTLMKRVEMLEASNSFKDVDRNVHVNASECPDAKQQSTRSMRMTSSRY